MKEIINIHTGQCGTLMGIEFWDLLSHEYSIGKNGSNFGQSSHLDGIQIFYNRCNESLQYGEGNFFQPRSIFVDTNESIFLKLKSSVQGPLLPMHNIVTGKCSSSTSTWANGYYTEGTKMIDTIMETIRKEVEHCDCLQGFQITHAIGGGTGSGLGSLIMSNIKEEYPDRLINSYTVMPSSEVKDTLVYEPYNSALSIVNLIRTTDITYCFDNEALFYNCVKNLKICYPSYKDFNYLIALAMSAITTSLRFPELCGDMNKYLKNMVPYPRAHFLIPSFTMSPHIFQSSFTVSEIMDDLLGSNSLMLSCYPEIGKSLALQVIFRGKISMKVVEDHMVNMMNSKTKYNISWFPEEPNYTVCDCPVYGLKMAATLINNSTSIRETFRAICKQFCAMYKRKAFVHWFLQEGMDQDEFENVGVGMNDIIYDLETLEGIQIERDIRCCSLI